MGSDTMFKELENLCAQSGYEFDALLSTPTGFICVLVDRMDNELTFQGATPQECVERAIERLVLLTGGLTH